MRETTLSMKSGKHYFPPLVNWSVVENNVSAFHALCITTFLSNHVLGQIRFLGQDPFYKIVPQNCSNHVLGQHRSFGQRPFHKLAHREHVKFAHLENVNVFIVHI